MKKVKTIMSIIVMVLVAMIATSTSYTNRAVRRVEASDDFLRSPEGIYVNEDYYVLYDSYDEKLKKYSVNANANETGNLLRTMQANIECFSASGDDCYCLINNGDDHPILAYIDLITMQKAELAVNSVLIADARLITNNGNTIYVYRESRIIQIFDKVGDGLTATGSIILASSSIGIDGEIEKIVWNNAKIILLTSTNRIYEVSTIADAGVYNSELKVESSNDILDITVDNNEILYAERIESSVQIKKTTESSSVYQTIPEGYSFNKMQSRNGVIYITDKENHIVYSTGVLGRRIFNSFPTPITLPSERLAYRKTRSSVELYKEPYSTTAMLTIGSGKPIVILSSTDTLEDYYYCLYTNSNANYYGYIKKTSEIVSESTILASITTQIQAIETKVYKFPSTVVDSLNTELTTVKNKEKVTRLLENSITNDKGESFYLVKTEDNKTGFIESKSTATYIKTEELLIECNAVTKRETKLYKGESNEVIIITIGANTRVRVNGKLNSTKDYTSVSYQTPDGTLYEGYMKTEDINIDGLSTLQIIGLVLVGVNVLVLSVIISLYKRNKRAKVIN